MIRREERATIDDYPRYPDGRGDPDVILTDHLSERTDRRDVLRILACGLTDERARAMPTVSPLSLGGSTRHVAPVERGWIDTMPGLAVGGVTG